MHNGKLTALFMSPLQKDVKNIANSLGLFITIQIQLALASFCLCDELLSKQHRETCGQTFASSQIKAFFS